MALEDIAASRAVHGSTVLYPSDANQTAKLVAAMADLEGISFLRTTRGATHLSSTTPTRSLRSEAARSCVRPTKDDVTIIGAGITLHEAVKAADALAEEGISARVIDLYSVKPIDTATLHAAAEATQGRIVTVEDQRNCSPQRASMWSTSPQQRASSCQARAHQHQECSLEPPLIDLPAQEKLDGTTTGDPLRRRRPLDYDRRSRRQRWRWAFDELYGIPADIGKFTRAGMTDPVVGRLTFTSVIGHEPSPTELATVISQSDEAAGGGGALARLQGPRGRS